MEKVHLLSSYSTESKKAISLLNENEIPFQESLESSFTKPPILFDPHARHPYVGLKDIENFVEVEVVLRRYASENPCRPSN